MTAISTIGLTTLKNWFEVREVAALKHCNASADSSWIEPEKNAVLRVQDDAVVYSMVATKLRVPPKKNGNNFLGWPKSKSKKEMPVSVFLNR
jgi:hypothetical protein